MTGAMPRDSSVPDFFRQKIAYLEEEMVAIQGVCGEMREANAAQSSRIDILEQEVSFLTHYNENVQVPLLTDKIVNSDQFQLFLKDYIEARDQKMYLRVMECLRKDDLTVRTLRAICQDALTHEIGKTVRDVTNQYMDSEVYKLLAAHTCKESMVKAITETAERSIMEHLESQMFTNFIRDSCKDALMAVAAETTLSHPLPVLSICPAPGVPVAVARRPHTSLSSTGDKYVHRKEEPPPLPEDTQPASQNGKQINIHSYGGIGGDLRGKLSWSAQFAPPCKTFRGLSRPN